MSDFESIKDKFIELIKARLQVSNRKMNVKSEFYYPKGIHLLKFNIEQYEIKELGNLAILQGKGMGVMKMMTAVFTPYAQKDSPLVIMDFIQMANKRTVFVEFYTQHMTQQDNVKALENRLKKLEIQYSKIPNYIEKPNWYTPLRNVYSPLKQATSKVDDVLEEMVLNYLQVYLEYVSQNKGQISNRNAKLEAFINDLIYKGNPSQDIMEKALGKQGTEKLFKEVIFYYK